MVIRNFNYIEAGSVEEASALLNKLEEQVKVIAGGNALVILMKQGIFRPTHLIDISRIPGLDEISLDKDDTLRIGALVTHRSLETSPLIRERFPIIAEMAKQVANIRVRNTGTIGGNLCHADPHSDPPALLIALGASIKAIGPKGERMIPLEEFFLDYYETALEKDEILTEVMVPAIPPRTGNAYQRFTTRSQTDKPCLNVAVALSLNARFTECEKARIVVGSAGTVPLRTTEAEQILISEPLEASINRAALSASQEVSPMSDLYGSEWYKREITRLLVERGINEAVAKAKSSA